MELTKAEQIIIELKKNRKRPTEIAYEQGVTQSYVSHIIAGRNKSKGPGAMRVRKAIAEAIHTNSEELWENN